MRAKAAENLCAGCLSKSKEKITHTARTLPERLQTGRAQGESSVQKTKVYAEMPAVPQEGKERL